MEVSVDFPPCSYWIPSHTSVRVSPRVLNDGNGIPAEVPVAHLELVYSRKITHRHVSTYGTVMEEITVRREKEGCSEPISLHQLLDVRTTMPHVQDLFSSLPSSTRRNMSTETIFGLAELVTSEAIRAAYIGSTVFKVVMEVLRDETLVPSTIESYYDYLNTDEGYYDYVHDDHEEEVALASNDSVDSGRDSSSEGEDQEPCAICLEAFASESSDAWHLPCRHGFHWDCITKWLHKRPSCPICRFQVNLECLLN